MKVEEIYAKISQNIVDEIDSSWSVATINSYLGRGCGHFEGRYKGNDDSTDEQCFDVSFATFELFEKMHEVTTEGGKNRWNRVKFTLYPDGKFNIDFEWDQALFDEIGI
tara:strand:+ start:717 stop:1043 length:327 start_codon:yes stop_codon:yes gene_type:complete